MTLPRFSILSGSSLTFTLVATLICGLFLPRVGRAQSPAPSPNQPSAATISKKDIAAIL
jgi:hypothetical protein